MTTEFAGVIEIEPPLTRPEIADVRRSGDGGGPESMPWTVSRDGTVLRARGPAPVETALVSLRLLVGSMERPEPVPRHGGGVRPRGASARRPDGGQRQGHGAHAPRAALGAWPVERDRPGHPPPGHLPRDRLVRGAVSGVRPPAPVAGLRPARPDQLEPRLRAVRAPGLRLRRPARQGRGQTAPGPS